MARTVSYPAGGRASRGVAAIAASLAVLGACTGGDDAAPPTTPAQPTTTIAQRVDDGQLVLGAYLPRTGSGTVIGEPMIEAVQRAVGDINDAGGVLGHDVALHIVDENSVDMTELVDRGVDAIIGPASSTVALTQLDDTVGAGSGVVSCSPTATALLLDGYPDNGLFFRTVPSDSLQMTAIAIRAGRTGVGSIALAYLDDSYGRGLRDSFRREADSQGIELIADEGFSPDRDQEALAEFAAVVLADDPGVVVVLGNADDGARLLAALDTATQTTEPPQIIVNEALRNGRQTIQTLSDRFREHVIGIAPDARAQTSDLAGFFTAHAVDCVNLIALAAIQAESDAPRAIQTQMAAASASGRECFSFADCVEKLSGGLQINYEGISGKVDLSSTTGDVTSGRFEVFAFDDEGVDFPVEPVGTFTIP